MTTASPEFVLFALVAALLVFGARHLRWGLAPAFALLACNLWFVDTFATGGPLQLLPFTGFVLLGFGLVRASRFAAVARHSGLLVTVILLVFFWLKRYAFVPEPLVIASPYVTLGLSYVLFRVLQIVIDARDETRLRTIALVDYLNYLLYFPAFVSGPIQRYQDWEAQQRAPAPVDWTVVGDSLQRIAIGAFKVIVVGPIFLGWHQGAQATLDAGQGTAQRGVAGAVVAGCYALYLFLNFSGYTDIVLAGARWMGMCLPENFDRPFSSSSFLEFWARWHMSLSNWLKTYVYSPVVKSLMQRYPQRKVEPYIGVFAFFVTFFLIGLWHGQTAVFALYGFLLGLGVSGNKLHQIAMTKRLGKKRYAALGRRLPYQAFGRGLTFTWFAFSLVCFWASWPQITRLCGLLGWTGVVVAGAVLFVVAGAGFTAVAMVRAAIAGLGPRTHAAFAHRYARTVVVTALLIVVTAMTVLTSGPAPDIVYKNF